MKGEDKKYLAEAVYLPNIGTGGTSGRIILLKRSLQVTRQYSSKLLIAVKSKS